MKVNNCLIFMGIFVFILIFLNLINISPNKVEPVYHIRPYSLLRDSLNTNQFLTLNNIEPFYNKEYITKKQCVQSVTQTCDRLANKNGLIKVSRLPDFYQGHHTEEEEEYSNKNYNFNNEEESCKPCS